MAKIQSVEQTEHAGLFSISFEADITEFDKFMTKFKDDAVYQEDFNIIIAAIQKMMNNGFLERYFRPEGRMGDRVGALPIHKSRLRLYCLRLSDSVLIVGNGGVKNTKTYEESDELSGYVIGLQKLDALLRAEEKLGHISIELANITGIENKEFEL
ncbi:MAG: hypothetical protein SPL28_04195 [Bacteroidales bacterium]|nr:hypothetical protein [Bacteroidales bacterium]